MSKTKIYCEEGNQKRKKVLRRSFFLFLPVPVASIIYFLIKMYDPYMAGSRPIFLSCVFHQLTGMYCPGCGLSRAIYDLIGFKVLDALRNNALFVLVVLPVLFYAILAEYLSFIFEKTILPRLRINMKWVILFVVIAVLFTILRNIPHSPWIYLAPL
jgi:undecaprenyl pyrophosphate phosphatase UppP